MGTKVTPQRWSIHNLCLKEVGDSCKVFHIQEFAIFLISNGKKARSKGFELLFHTQEVRNVGVWIFAL